MSVEAMLLIAKPSVRDIIRQIPRLVQTVIPEPFRLYKGNAKGVLVNPTGICVADHGSLFITDNKKSCLFLARLHYPVEITGVSKSLKSPNGVIYVNGVVFVADTGNGRLAYKATLSSVFIEPKKMKIDELRIQVEERNIPTVAEARKKELVGALSKWISDQRKAVKYSATDLNTLPLDEEIKFPLAVTAAATDMLMVTDGHSHCVFQVTISNNGACLRGTVTQLLKLPESSQPYGLAFTGNDLYISDSSSDGGIIKLNLTTSESAIIVNQRIPMVKLVE